MRDAHEDGRISFYRMTMETCNNVGGEPFLLLSWHFAGFYDSRYEDSERAIPVVPESPMQFPGNSIPNGISRLDLQ